MRQYSFNRFTFTKLVYLRRLSLFLAVAATFCGVPRLARAQNEAAGNWVGTWAAAPFATPNKNSAFAKDTTLREIVHVSVGGSAIRVILTNEFGTSDLKVGGVAVALPSAALGSANSAGNRDNASGKSDPGSQIQSGSSVIVRFGGQPTVTIAPGALAISDPLPFRLVPESDLAVSLFIAGQTIDVMSYHGFADQTNYQAEGNQLTANALESAEAVRSWFFLKGIDVEGSARAAIVCFGDSITDGARSKVDTNHRYPDFLAARLHANPPTAGIGVLNEGIGGNRVLHDGTGPSALARFDRDVIAQAGVRWVILLEGINDIGRLAAPKAPGDAITADDLIRGYQQLITRAHLHGIKVFGATLTPYQGAGYDSEPGEATREKVNDFIRNSGQFDAVIDFSKATADPANPKRFSQTTDGGDHLHPSDVGYKAMADSIDLNLFTP